MNDIPAVGEIVFVKTRLHDGEPACVTGVHRTLNRGRLTGRVFVRLASVDGSLYGAQGWYEPHEFHREQNTERKP